MRRTVTDVNRASSPTFEGLFLTSFRGYTNLQINSAGFLIKSWKPPEKTINNYRRIYLGGGEERGHKIPIWSTIPNVNFLFKRFSKSIPKISLWISLIDCGSGHLSSHAWFQLKSLRIRRYSLGNGGEGGRLTFELRAESWAENGESGSGAGREGISLRKRRFSP